MKKVIIFCVCLILSAVGIVYLFLRQSLPSVQALRCDVQPNEFIQISSFEVKILDTDKKIPQRNKDSIPLPRTASLQWRCYIYNISTGAIRYELTIEFLDKDGFILATGTIDSNYGQGDLVPGKWQSVHSDIILEYSRAKNLTSCRIAPKALKTDFQLQSERQQQILQQQEQQQKLTQQLAEINQQRDAERQKQIDEIRERWKRLTEGMSKTDVQELLGKPKEIRAYSMIGDIWVYPAIEGSYHAPRVEFTPTGYVKGWEMP